MENKKTGLRMDCGCNLYTDLLSYNEISGGFNKGG